MTKESFLYLPSITRELVFQTDAGMRSHLGSDVHFDAKTAIKEAFHYAKNKSADHSKYGDHFLEFREFRLFLQTLRQYFEYYEAFKRYEKIRIAYRKDLALDYCCAGSTQETTTESTKRSSCPRTSRRPSGAGPTATSGT